MRTKMLAWVIALLALATVSSVLVTHEVLLIRLDQRLDADLKQEAAELRRLASGNDPATGLPFGEDVKRVFEVFLERNVPSRNESLITFVDGRPFLRTRQVVPYRLDSDPALIAHWGSLRDTKRGRVSTPAGPVEYLAVPVSSSNGGTAGVFVAAIFHDRARSEANAAVRAAGVVGIAVLLIGSVLAWRLADRLVRPVTELTRTAHSISETDLTGRIPVHGHDETAQLASTFNDMVERLGNAFASQRRFVDDAGHELKTPITIIRGHLELLEDEPEEREQTLALVMDELDRMGRIVDDLLLLAKYEQPDFLDLATVDVATLTDELYAKARALAPRREWILENHGRGVMVADRQRVTQAIVQLAENAARYSHDGAAITLGSSIGGGEVRFWVQDRGPGIPLHEQSPIFERFHRGTGGRGSEGAGLGLAIVSAIALAHHGRVALESRAGEGARFSIVIPVDQPPDIERALA